MDKSVFDSQIKNLKAVFKGFTDEYVRVILEKFAHIKDETFIKAVNILLETQDRTPTLKAFHEAVQKALRSEPKSISNIPTYQCPVCLDSGFLTAIMHSNKFNRNYEFSSSCPNKSCNSKFLNTYPLIDNKSDFVNLKHNENLKFIGYLKKFAQLKDDEKPDDIFNILQDENGNWIWKKQVVANDEREKQSYTR